MIESMKVFICHANEDLEIAEKLYNDLKREGISPWLAKKDILPGERWEETIHKKIKESSFFLALLSSHSISKNGFVQKELKIGLKLLDNSPKSNIFIIPVRLEECEPDDETLKSLHRVDLFASYEDGFKQILRVLKPERKDTLTQEKYTPVTYLKDTHKSVFSSSAADGQYQKNIPHIIFQNSQSKACLEQLDILIKRNMLFDEDIPRMITELAGKLNNEYFFAKSSVKAEVLFYAALWICNKTDNLPEVDKYVCELENLDSTKDTRRISAARMYCQGKTDEALKLLDEVNTPESKSQLFTYLYKGKGPEKALEWLDTFDFSFELLSDWGWGNVAIAMAEAGKWEDSFDLVVQYRSVNNKEVPDFACFEALLHITFLIAEDDKLNFFKGIILPGEEFLIDGPDVDEHRDKALECLEISENTAQKYSLELRLNYIMLLKAWLLLTNPKSKSEGEIILQRQLESSKPNLGMLGLAARFKTRINLIPVQRYLQRQEILGALSSEELHAKLELLIYQNDTEQIIRFLQEEEDQLIGKRITRRHWAGLLIEKLMEKGEYRKAEEILLAEKEILKDDASRFEMMLADLKGDDISDQAVMKYKKSGKLIDLMNLCDYLKRKKDYSELRGYAIELYQQQKKLKNALRAAYCLRELGNNEEIVSFLDKCKYYVQINPELQRIKAWALLHLGRFSEAQSFTDLLIQKCTDEDILALQLNIYFNSGHWERVYGIIEREMERSESYSSHNLLKMAKMVSIFNRDLSMDLLEKAVQSSPEDIHTLASAGFIAVQLGKDEIGFLWMYEAQKLCGSEGPIKKFRVEQLKDILTEIRESSEYINNMFHTARISWHMFCRYENMPLCRPLIAIVLENQDETDIRKKTFLPIRHGVRENLDLSKVKNIAMDITSLFLAEVFNIFPMVLECFEKIYIPWELMNVLLEEECKALFHQPSRIEKAKHLLDLIDNKKSLSVFNDISKPPTWLIREVGKEDAEFLQMAKHKNGRFVTTLPIHRAGSLLTEIAELREYADFIATPGNIVRAIREQGNLSLPEFENIMMKLNARDPSEDYSNEDLGQGPLYIDNLAVEYLISAGALHKVAHYSQCFIHAETYSESQALVALERQGTRVADILKNLRKQIRDGITDGKIICKPLVRGPDKKFGEFMGVLSLLHDYDSVDAVWVDDRMLGKSANVPDSSGKRAIMIGISDVIKELAHRKILTPQENYDLHYRMRQANLIMIPFEKDELDHYLKACKVGADGKIKETAELRAIRQNYQHLISFMYLQIPDEKSYLEQSQQSVVKLIKQYWSEHPLNMEVAAARSNWLIDSLYLSENSIRHLHLQDKENDFWHHIISREISLLLNMLITDTAWRIPNREAYRKWFDEKLLYPLQLSNSRVIQDITDSVKFAISNALDQFEREEILPYMAALPSLISNFIFEDENFVKETNLPYDSYLGIGDAFDVKEKVLLNAARQVFKSNEPVEISGKENERILVVPSGKNIEVHFTDKSGRQIRPIVKYLGYLHPEKSVRLESLESVIQDIGLVHPDISFWKNLLSNGPLSDKKFSEYLHSVESVYHFELERIDYKIKKFTKKRTQSLNPDFLVPDRIEYFENLVAPVPFSLNYDEYLAQTLKPRMQKLINLDLDLTQVLEIILPIGLQNDLSANQFMGKVPAESLQKAIEELLPIHDPVSKINLLDICLSRFESGPFFSDLASQLVKELTQDEKQNEDKFRLFEMLLHFTAARIRVTPVLKDQPIFWKRLCAWVHSAHLTRALSNWKFDYSWLSWWLDTSKVAYHPVGEILEYFEISVLGHLYKHFDVEAYIHRRIFDIVPRHDPVKIQDFDYNEFIEKCTSEEFIKSGKYFSLIMPGPLELSYTQPIIQSEFSEKQHYPEWTDNFTTQKESHIDVDIWCRLFLFSQFASPPEKTYQIVLKRIKSIIVNDLNCDQIEKLRQVLQYIALVSHKIKSTEMSDEVLRIIYDLAKLEEHENIGMYLSIAMCCCMTNNILDQALKDYSNFLINIAYIVRQNKSIQTIFRIVQDLKALLPITHWHFSRIEALCVSFSGSDQVNRLLI